MRWGARGMDYEGQRQYRRGDDDRSRGRGDRWRRLRMEGPADRMRWEDRPDYSDRYERRWHAHQVPSPRQTLPASMRGAPRTMIEVESEKEMVDTIVACVSEQVERIVRNEVRLAIDELINALRKD